MIRNMQKLYSLLSGLLINLVVVDGVLSDAITWDHLSVTFRHFTTLPRNETQAVHSGWTLIQDHCQEGGNFYGRRFMLNNDYANIMIFDMRGNVVGMQMAYNASLKKGHYGKYNESFELSTEKQFQQPFYHVTAYFTEQPKDICNLTIYRPKNVIGRKLVIMTGVDKYMVVPNKELNLKGTKWVKGRCFPGMGQHYWYDIGLDMKCNDLFPFFLLYSKEGELFAFGFITDVNVRSRTVEHPPPTKALGAFFEFIPKCLLSISHRTAQHIYLTKIGNNTHTCNRDPPPGSPASSLYSTQWTNLLSITCLLIGILIGSFL